MRFEADNTAILDKKEREKMTEVAHMAGGLARLAKPNSKLKDVAAQVNSGLLAILAHGEVIDLDGDAASATVPATKSA
jgi:hypothetical protein